MHAGGGFKGRAGIDSRSKRPPPAKLYFSKNQIGKLPSVDLDSVRVTQYRRINSGTHANLCRWPEHRASPIAPIGSLP